LTRRTTTSGRARNCCIAAGKYWRAACSMFFCCTSCFRFACYSCTGYTNDAWHIYQL
jgi:hypothetical protein